MAIATERIDFKHLKQSARKEGVQKFTVGALISSENRFLVLRRKPKGPNAGKWEPPGGKVEKGENLHTAVVREVYEETRLTVTSVDKLLGQFDFVAKTGISRRAFLFVASTKPGKIWLKEHDEHLWVTVHDASELEGTTRLHKTLEYLSGKHEILASAK